MGFNQDTWKKELEKMSNEELADELSKRTSSIYSDMLIYQALSRLLRK